MLNSVNMVGRLTKRPDFSVTQSNIEVAGFTLAVEDSYKDRNGEKKVNFIRCVAFRGIAKNVSNYLDKGSLISITGKLQARSYDNKEGKRIFVTEVVADNVDFIDTRRPETDQRNTSTNHQTAYSGSSSKAEDNPYANADGTVDISDSDLPF